MAEWAFMKYIQTKKKGSCNQQAKEKYHFMLRECARFPLGKKINARPVLAMTTRQRQSSNG
jgi:hypothetical protein